MTDLAGPRIAVSQKPPASSVGILGWLRANLFNSIPSTILTLAVAYLVALYLPPLLRWLFLDAAWTAPNAAECHKATGACWAFIGEWYRFILFGRFEYEEQWRPLLVIVVFIAMFVSSCDRRLWGKPLVGIWVGGAALALLLMFGGVLGMKYMDTTQWNGLPLTLILAVFGMVFAFPLSIMLALGRRSKMPAIRALCVAYIELIRGVPLITILFMASLMLPLFLPTGMTIDKLLRAQLGIIFFSAAYLAEIIRGGLQAIPKGQSEAADALGLSYFRKMRMIIVPQALALVIPPLVNTFIGTFKDTSLVIIIGLFDLLNTTNNALNDANWRGFYREAYIFVGIIYWVFCFFMSKYSQYLERDLNKARRR